MSNDKNCYPHIVREFKEAYLTMAREVKYRPPDRGVAGWPGASVRSQGVCR